MTRRIPIVVVAVVVLAIAAVVAAAALIRSDRVAAVASNQPEARLGQPLHIDAIQLDLLPCPGVALAGMRLGDVGTPVATMQDAAQRVLPDSLKGVSADSLRKVLTDTLGLAVKDSLGAELADSHKARADSAKKALEQRLKSNCGASFRHSYKILDT